jgi:hypothetical protein
MAKLYIANCTKQVQEFHYWAPEVPRPMRQMIPIGEQILVYKDAPLEDLEKIVEQHRSYGLVEASEAAKQKGFVGLVYSFDKPIKGEGIIETIEHNDVVLDEQSQEYRTEAAVALNNSVANALAESGVPGSLTKLEIGIKEESKPGDNSNKLEEKIEVSDVFKGKEKK